VCSINKLLHVSVSSVLRRVDVCELFLVFFLFFFLAGLAVMGCDEKRESDKDISVEV
jgi:hypothetical protein